jgi:ribonuclease HI
MVASKRESLCMAMLRSKYKVRADWMRRNPIKGASPIWRAIEKSKKVIKKGACFLVGDGCAINVWMDPWIPWIEGFKPRPRDPVNPKDPMSVSTLINSSTREWRLELLLDLFDMETVAAIQKIRLPFFSRPDKLVWIKDPKGQFSAKSAYKMCQENSSSQPQDPLWKNLWKLKVHDRVKMLLWRIASNVLPTKDNLDQRLGVSDTACPLCNEAKETIIHLFLECSIAKAIWFGSCWSIRVDTLPAANCTDIVKLVLEPPNSSNDKEMKELSSLQFAHTLEAIWNLRNKVVHGEGKINLIATIKSLEKKVLEFKRIGETSESMMQSNYQTHWTPPPPGFVKINVDAAVANSRTTLAVVARNEHGNIVKAWAKEHMAGDALFAEASAFLWALQLAKNSGMQQIIVEGDAKLVVEALLKNANDVSWTIAAIISDALVLASSFSSCKFGWIKRDGNTVAHMLAKFASQSNLVVCNNELIPQVVKEACWKDVMFFS